MGVMCGMQQLSRQLGCMQLASEVEESTAATIQLLMWQLYGAQGQLRGLIDREQADIAALQDRNYRRFTRNCWKIRQDAARQVGQLNLFNQACARRLAG